MDIVIASVHIQKHSHSRYCTFVATLTHDTFGSDPSVDIDSTAIIIMFTFVIIFCHPLVFFKCEMYIYTNS